MTDPDAKIVAISSSRASTTTDDDHDDNDNDACGRETLFFFEKPASQHGTKEGKKEAVSSRRIGRPLRFRVFRGSNGEMGGHTRSVTFGIHVFLPLLLCFPLRSWQESSAENLFLCETYAYVCRMITRVDTFFFLRYFRESQDQCLPTASTKEISFHSLRKKGLRASS